MFAPIGDTHTPPKLRARTPPHYAERLGRRLTLDLGGEMLFTSLMAQRFSLGVAGRSLSDLSPKGIGTPVGADLTLGTWLWGDGSLQSITDTIKTGVPQPKQHAGTMPPLGGVALSDNDVAAVAAYVWAIGHQKKG